MKVAVLWMLFAFPALAKLGPIERVQVDGQRTLVMKADTKGTPEAVGTELARIFPAVLAHIEKAGMTPLSPPFARFFSYEPGTSAFFEAGFVARVQVGPEGDIAVSSLPRAEVARITHYGPYEKLLDAYDALSAWMKENQYLPADAPWEVYLNDPSTVPPEQIETQIFFPIK